MFRGDFIKRVYDIDVEIPIRRQFLKAAININGFIKDYIDNNTGFVLNSVINESDFYYVIPYRYDQNTIKINKITLASTMNGDYTIYTKITFDCIIVFKRQLITNYTITKSTSVVNTDDIKTRVVSLKNIVFNLIESTEIKSKHALLHNLIYAISTDLTEPIKFNGYCVDMNDINVISGKLDQPMVDFLIEKNIIQPDTDNTYSTILEQINKHIKNRK